MTPQERQMIDELFERLASLESGRRDADAVAAINEGLRRAPNALYPLVQTVLVQDEALKRADARIQEFESQLGIEPGQGGAQPPGFLDSMRDALFGKPHGSVPTVRPGAPGSPWRSTGAQPAGYQPPPQAPEPSSGGSFLGTAAATAAGVVGGALLMNSFRGMFGGGHQGFGGSGLSGSGGAPWGPGAGGSDLARQAGVDDIGRGGAATDGDGGSQRAGLFDIAQNDDVDSDNDSDSDLGDGDLGGDSDTA